MRTGNLRLAALVAAAVTAVAVGSALAADGEPSDDQVAISGQDTEFVDALLAIEPDLPGLLPSSAMLAAGLIDLELSGSFTSARSALDAVEDDLRQLYITADSANSPVADAVATVAKGLLVERQALLVLEITDDASNPRPLDSSDARDENDVAIDADGLLGTTLTGLEILLDAREQQRLGYAVLSEVPDGVDDAGVFDRRYDELLEYADTAERLLRDAVGEPAQQLLAPLVRNDAPLGVARAVSVTYVCVDRDAYLAMEGVDTEERIAATLSAIPSQDCLDAARRAGLDLQDQVAEEELLDGVQTTVGTGGTATGDTATTP